MSHFSMSCGTQTGMTHHKGFVARELGGSVLQSMVDLLNQPPMKQCTQCQGRGLLAHHIVCPSCKGYGRMP